MRLFIDHCYNYAEGHECCKASRTVYDHAKQKQPRQLQKICGALFLTLLISRYGSISMSTGLHLHS